MNDLNSFQLYDHEATTEILISLRRVKMFVPIYIGAGVISFQYSVNSISSESPLTPYGK